MTPGPSRTSPERLRKYTKSERTHEENQERAYIAASRRSDRSLEARMESARRASEIHKRRCGRGFRITEEAVLNEEMYDEEDPDYGHRIRRLYSALANDPAVLQQQWLRAQWLMLGQNNGKFAPGSAVPPIHNSTQAAESLPFFAYQPGPEPSSTPIRPLQQQQQSPQTTTSGSFSAIPGRDSPSTFKLDQQRANHPYLRSQGIIKQEQPVSPTSPITSPSPSVPIMRFGDKNPFDMMESAAVPYPAQLNLFTYPMNSLIDGNIGYSYGQNVSNAAGSGTQAGPTITTQSTESSGAPGLISNFSTTSPSTASFTNNNRAEQVQSQISSHTSDIAQTLPQFFYPGRETNDLGTIPHQTSSTGNVSLLPITSAPQSFDSQATSQLFTTTDEASTMGVGWGDASFEQETNDLEPKRDIYDDWIDFPLGSQD